MWSGDKVTLDSWAGGSTNEYHITEQTVFHILDHLRVTATGLDGLPAWFMRLEASFFALPITTLFNLSLSLSFIPSQ